MNPFLAISIGLNLLFVLSAILFTCYFFDLEVSSKMGDTIGGTLGPLVNIVAIIYVYKTYQDQKEALNVQVSSLAHQQAASFEQMSISLHSEIITSIKEAEIAFETIKSQIPVQKVNGAFKIEQRSGKILLDQFPRVVHIGDFFSSLRMKDEEFLTDLLTAYQKIETVVVRKHQLSGLMTDAHSSDLDIRILEILQNYGKHVDKIFSVLTVFGNMIPIGGSNTDIVLNISANKTMDFLKKYQAISETLENHSFKVRIVQDNQEDSHPFAFTFDPRVSLDTALQDSIDWKREYE